MIQDVEGGRATFNCILVYDISRWGRFQDADEAAYYEFICRCAGVAVYYCAVCGEDPQSTFLTAHSDSAMSGVMRWHCICRIRRQRQV